MGARLTNELKKQKDPNYSETAEMRKQFSKEQNHIKRKQQALDRSDNPDNAEEKATKNAFINLQQTRMKLA